ncbi:carnitine dehydratase [Microbacterium sp. Root61]|nr:carnitine dehydratase [Microbacterium sp. Root61]
MAVAYSSDRYLRIDDAAPDVWSPMSGFFRTSDGWVRTHANYPHHAAALRGALGLPADADRGELAQVLAARPSTASAHEVSAAGGLCVTVERERPAVDASLRETPLVRLGQIGPAAARVRPRASEGLLLHGVRVLDLTRVIAGPVATRTLALLGAEVLRIDPPGMAEPEWQHFDTGHGKTSALLDIGGEPEHLHRLLDDADVVVLGYRPRALDARGLSPAQLADRHPGLVVARLSAWGFDAASADRRGFDSLVQAASGIAWIESIDGETPGALPAQALDHTAGYLLAAAVMELLRRQATTGGTWLAETSLRRIAAELLGMPRTDEPASVAPIESAAHLQHFDVDGVRLTTAAPALSLGGKPLRYSAPGRWGRDDAEWL